MQTIPFHNLIANDIPENSTFVTVQREMLQNEPDIWYDKKRKKFVLIIHEKDHAGKTFRRRISTFSNNKAQAKLFKTEWLVKQAEGNRKISQPFTVANALNDAFDSKRDNQNLRPSSCREIERSIRYFVEFIRKETGDNAFQIGGVTFELCDSFLRSILRPNQRITHRANLSTLWNKLINFRTKYGIMENPFKFTDKPKLPQTDPEQLTEREFREWYEQARTDTFQMQMCRLASAFSFYTGLRQAEICFLRVTHTTGENVLVRKYHDHIPKSKQNRDVPHTIKTREILHHVFRLKSQHTSALVRESECLFCTEKGGNLILETLSKYFTGCRRQSLPKRTKVTFHALRRSFGQNLLNEGFLMAEVSYLLGHSSIAVTEKHYASTRNLPLDRIREKMNRLELQTPSLERSSALTPEAEHPELSEADTRVLNSLGIRTGAVA